MGSRRRISLPQAPRRAGVYSKGVTESHGFISFTLHPYDSPTWVNLRLGIYGESYHKREVGSITFTNFTTFNMQVRINSVEQGLGL